MLQKLPDILAGPDLWHIGKQVGDAREATLLGNGKGRLVFSSAEEATTAALALDGALIGLDGELLSESTLSACRWNDALEAKTAADDRKPGGGDAEPLLCDICGLDPDSTGTDPQEGPGPRRNGLGIYVLRRNCDIPSFGYAPAAVEVDAGFRRQGR